MACIIKLPTTKSKGIISFTSPENRDIVPNLKHFLNQHRENWIYLLHHNWQPCQHDYFYDSSLCNKIDLVGSGDCLDMDCCNFSPSIYHPLSGGESKTFDILFVTRAVTFKRLDVFYKVCKEILQVRPKTKILLICSIPEVDCYPEDPEQLYLNMFTREERKNFLALFFKYDYPFTVSKDFLAHFYQSSKVFLHTANEERHPRVCSYAWSTGIPVVGYRDLSTFLPIEFQKPPFFYEVKDDSLYVEKIIEALDAKFEYDEIKNYVNESYSFNTFKKKLKNLFDSKNLFFEDTKFFPKNLDFRMGRHCTISLGDNSLKLSIEDLIRSSYDLSIDDDVEDIELLIEKKLNIKE